MKARPRRQRLTKQLARRYGEATARVIAARQTLEAAVVDDDAKAEAAIRDGQPLPKATKTEKARSALDEAERERELVSTLIPTSARELLRAVEPHASDVAERVDDAGERAGSAGARTTRRSSRAARRE